MAGTPTLAAEALARGELIILPTETVYGLGADAADAEAVAHIFEAKGRPRFNPLIAHVADVEAARTCGMFDGRAEALAAAFWPGPLTLVLPVALESGVSDLARAGLETVAVRVPNHPNAQAVLRAFGGPVVAPSANRSGRPSPTTFADAMEEVGHAAAIGVDGGPCAIGLESTVVAVLGGPMRLLRPGAVTREQLEAVAGPLAEAGDNGHRSPGRLLAHYAPEAPLRLNASDRRSGEVRLTFGHPPEDADDLPLSETGDLREAAARLFTLLRAADRRRPTAIAVERVPDHDLGEAINDRLRRGAGLVG